MSQNESNSEVEGMVEMGTSTTTVGRAPFAANARRRLLAGLPVAERRIEAAGIGTAVLEGGQGPPVLLLHGPGESGVKWLRIVPGLVRSHRVIAPDLPAHGSSLQPDDELDSDRLLDWLECVIEQTCPAPPVLVGHVLGGAIAARYAIHRGDDLDRIVLVDTLGLARFRPSPRFALAMMRFLRRPSERSFDRFMQQCSYDFDGLREGMGQRWDPFVAYNLEGARGSGSRAVTTMMREVGLPRIQPRNLAGIRVPVHLIWGRQDRANRLRIAEAASARYGWPLQVIEECADDPARDRPGAFLDALRLALDRPEGPR